MITVVAIIFLVFLVALVATVLWQVITEEVRSNPKPNPNTTAAKMRKIAKPVIASRKADMASRVQDRHLTRALEDIHDVAHDGRLQACLRYWRHAEDRCEQGWEREEAVTLCDLLRAEGFDADVSPIYPLYGIDVKVIAKWEE